MSSISFKSFKNLSKNKDGEINKEINEEINKEINEDLINNRKKYIKKTLEILNNIFNHNDDNIEEYLDYISTLNDETFNEIYVNFIGVINNYIRKNNPRKDDNIQNIRFSDDNIQNIRFSDVLYTNLRNIKRKKDENDENDENDEKISIKDNLETLFTNIKDLIIIFKGNKDKLNSSEI